MESAQQAEEELQQSVVVSEEDMEADDSSAVDGNNRLPTASPSSRRADLAAEEPQEMQDVAVIQQCPPQQPSQPHEHYTETTGPAQDGDDGSDDDISVDEGDTKQEHWVEGGDDLPNAPSDKDDQDARSSLSDSSASSASDEDADDEAVGAVKIRPGEIDDDASHDSDSEGTEETESAAAWEDARDGDAEGDEDSEAVASNTCIFCKEDEEHDPGEEFEEPLECISCGEYSHQLCARQANAVHHESTVDWMCPECMSRGRGTSRHDDEDESIVSDQDMHNVPNTTAVEDQQQTPVARARKRRTSPVSTEEPSMSLRKRIRKTADDDLGHSLSNSNPEVPEAEQSRRLRLKVSHKQHPVTLHRGPQSLIVTIRTSPSRLQEILASSTVGNRKRSSRPGTSRASLEGALPPPLPFVSAAIQPFYSFLDRDTDDLKSKPYGGILSDANADTSKTLPAPEDRRRFDEAKQQAEEEWRVLHAADSALQRLDQRKKPKKSGGPASQIECIEFGGWEIDTWYAAPYPEEYSRNRTLYICEFCLKYMNSDYVAWRHKLKCPAKHPPGDEIYRHGSVSVFEVDGRKNPVYCQNLCLLAKLFLGSKTLYYDVEPFLFYVLCEHDDLGYHFVGYFSKEKRVSSQNNVSCILTLPIHQRKGYGNLLIDFSYLLTRVERKTGSPEKPLSDMGLVSYRNYWRLVMCEYLLGHWSDSSDSGAPPGFSIRHISDETGLTPDDVISALEGLRCLAKDAQTGLYAFRVDLAYCRDYLSKWEGKGYVKLRPDALTWTPYVMGRGNATNFELGPAITAIAPREEDGDPKVLLPSGEKAGFVASTSPGTAVLPTAPQVLPPMQEDAGAVLPENDMAKNGEVDIRDSTEPCELELMSGVDSEQPMARLDDARESPCATQNWAAPYQDIPPSRFEVFPALAGRRLDRPRHSAIRPTMVRPMSDLARPKPPRTGPHRRSTTSRPKTASSSRRKTGGTGRGPGRWPKGTKKSDYGNASSGPGLPPGWIKEKQPAPTTNAGIEGEDPVPSGVPGMDSVSVRFDEERDLATAAGKEASGEKATSIA